MEAIVTSVIGSHLTAGEGRGVLLEFFVALVKGQHYIMVLFLIVCASFETSV